MKYFVVLAVLWLVAPSWMSPERVPWHPRAAVAVPVLTRRDSLVVSARQQLGRRYKFGGADPRGFDCSGLVQYVFGKLHVRLPRTAIDQRGGGRSTKVLLPGDLVFFGDSVVRHVGIYVGAGRYVHASTRAGRVVERVLDRSRVVGSRRILAGEAHMDVHGHGKAKAVGSTPIAGSRNVPVVKLVDTPS